MTFDIRQNRATRKYTLEEMTRRVLWMSARPLFENSPRPVFGWRRGVLRSFGARIGEGVHIYPSADIYFPWNLEVGDWSAIGERARIYDLGPVRLGRNVTVSQGAHLCAGTHDYEDPAMTLRKPPIVIEDDVWVCADAFIGPGVRVGRGAVVAARAVVTRDVEPWTVVAGNPARVVKKRNPPDGDAP